MKNMGDTDRVIRLLIVAVIAVAYWFGFIGGYLAVGLGVLSAIFVVTSLASTCPGYMPFGISTRHRA